MFTLQQYRYASLIGALIAAPAVSAEIIMQPGAWELRSTGAIVDTHGKPSAPVTDTSRRLCFKQTYLEQEPYLSSHVDKARMEQSGECSVIDEVRQASTASWHMFCQSKDGTRFDLKTQSIASSQSMNMKTFGLITNPGNTTAQAILFEQTAQRSGDCTPGMAEP